VSGELDNRTVFRYALVAGVALTAIGLAATAVYVVRGVLVLGVVALFAAVSLDPAVRWLVRLRVRRGWAVGIIFILAFFAVAGMIWAVVPPLVREANELSDDLPGYIAMVTEQSRPLRELGDRYGLTQGLQDLAKDLPGRIGASVLTIVQGMFGAIFSGLTVIALTIYFMADLPRLRAGVVRLFPPASRAHARRTVDVTVDKVGAYMIGNIIISIFAGVTSFVALTALQAPFALPLAVVVAVTDLIPMIGATLGAVVCVFVSAIAADLWPTTVLVALFFVAYQQIENYLIAPRVLRNAVDISAVAVLIASLIGGTVLGLIGALMAIPVAAVVKVLISPKLAEMDAVETASAQATDAVDTAGAEPPD
jgi:predicted PurR-regulated permease PerM